MRTVVERLATVGGHDDDVLDTGTPTAAEVDSRFDAEGHTFDEFDGVASTMYGSSCTDSPIP